MSDLNTTLADFAQFLGEQDKALKTALTASIGTAKTEAIEAASTAADAKIGTAKTELQSTIQTAVSALKTELIGGASEELDTFKELSEALNQLKASGSSVPESLLQKITEVTQTANGIKTNIESITLEALKARYTAAATA